MSEDEFHKLIHHIENMLKKGHAPQRIKEQLQSLGHSMEKIERLFTFHALHKKRKKRRKTLLVLSGVGLSLLLVLGIYVSLIYESGPYALDLSTVDTAFGLAYELPDGTTEDGCAIHGIRATPDELAFLNDCTLRKTVPIPSHLQEKPLTLRFEMRGDSLSFPEEWYFNDSYRFEGFDAQDVLDGKIEDLSFLSINYTHIFGPHRGKDRNYAPQGDPAIPMYLDELRSELDNSPGESKLWWSTFILYHVISGDHVDIFYLKAEKYDTPYPLLQVRVGDQINETIEVKGDWASYEVELSATRSELILELEFLNDYLDRVQSKDRNIYIRQILLQERGTDET